MPTIACALPMPNRTIWTPVPKRKDEREALPPPPQGAAWLKKVRATFNDISMNAWGKEADVDASTLSKLESGQTNTTGAMIYKLVQALVRKYDIDPQSALRLHNEGRIAFGFLPVDMEGNVIPPIVAGGDDLQVLAVGNVPITPEDVSSLQGTLEMAVEVYRRKKRQSLEESQNQN